MKKYLLFTTFLLLVSGIKAQELRLAPVKTTDHSKSITKEAPVNTLMIGHCDEIAMSWQLGAKNINLKAATKLPAELMEKYMDNSITKIKVGIGTDSEITNAKIFLSYSLEGESFYSQDVTFKGEGWNEITLDTPYKIENKDIFIGFMLTSGSNAKATVFATDKEISAGYDYLAMAENGANLEWRNPADLGMSYNLGIRAVVEGNSLPQYEYTFDYLMPSKLVVAKEDKIALSGLLKNTGTQTINSFDLVYQAGDAEPVTVKKEGLNINCLDKYSFTINDVPVNADKNLTSFKVTLNNFNGNITTPNADLTVSTLIPGENSVARKVLLENFTTANCTYCPQGHETLKAVVNDNPNIIWVAHHAGFGTDKYTIPASSMYTWFYNNNGSLYAPAMMLDRSDFRNSGATPQGESVVFGVSKTMATSTIKAAQEIPAYTTIKIDKTFNPESHKLNVTVSGKALYGNLPGMARVNVFLTESGVIGPQTSGGNKYEHNNLIRAAITGTWGEVIGFDAEGNYSKTYEYTLDDSWVPSNMNIVAFLSNYDMKDALNCPVFNAEAALLYPEGSIINTSGTDDSFARIYSNDSQISIEGEFNNATIYDTTGKVIEVLGAEKISSKLANGVYFVKITNNDQTIVNKIAVK